jgi:hypothetical protein
MEKLSIAEAIEVTAKQLLRPEGYVHPTLTMDLAKRAAGLILESFPCKGGEVEVRIAQTRMEAVAMAEALGCPRSDLVSSDGKSVLYDGLGGATSVYWLGGALSAVRSGEYVPSPEDLARLELAGEIVASCADTILLHDEDGKANERIAAYMEALPEADRLRVQLAEEVSARHVNRGTTPDGDDAATIAAGDAVSAAAEAHASTGGRRRPVLIVIALPPVEKRDDRARLHCADGPAVAYSDEEQYFWHGVSVDKDIITRDTWTAAEIEAIKNTEERRALAERLGGDKIAKIMQLKEVNTWTDPSTSLTYRLLRSDVLNIQYLEMQSPALHDGTQPTYLESVHRELKTAAGARRWRFADDDESPEDCDDNPTLTYRAER